MEFLNEPTEPWLLADNNDDKGGDHDKGLSDIQMTLDKLSKESDRNVPFQLIDIHLMIIDFQRLMEDNGNVDFTADGRHIVNVAAAKSEMTACLSDNTKYEEFRCDFHNEEGASEFCCLSKVTRMARALQKYCSSTIKQHIASTSRNQKLLST